MLIHHRYWLAPSTLLLLWSAAPAWAQEDEPPFKLSAGYSRLSDSNPLRLPADPNAIARQGIPNTEDQISTSTLGFSFNTRQSLQQFELDVNLIDYQYQNFSDRNFTAHNYNAAWRWALTPRMHGNFTTDRKESLNTDRKESLDSSADDQGVPRTNTNTRLDGVYELDGVWRVLGGVSKSTQTNLLTPGQPQVQPPVIGEDYNSSSADLGLRYAFTSGSALTYTAKTTEGKYLNHLASPDGAYDGSFSQLDNELRLRWILTGNTTANFSAAHITRTHPHFAQLDYSGLNSGVSLNWNITGKTALAAGWTRELASNQHVADGVNNYNSTSSQTNRFSLGPVWKASAKTVVRLNYEFAQRDYVGSPTGVDAAAQRSDTMHNTTLAVAWQPYKYVTLGASLQKATRASTLPDLDYDSNMATLSAKFSY
ncbi:MAG: putative exosortase B-associated extracellular polysaccharide biosynthesis transporter EpsL [Rhodoferax sp.]|nr:putative exosortase B-associated extracellular polysaccharide biosynthesis transporter EpsL [Rhodoferax sp.]